MVTLTPSMVRLTLDYVYANWHGETNSDYVYTNSGMVGITV